MVYNMRRKVTSSAKKKRDPRSSHIHQTPEGAFFDLQRNAWQVLQRCGMKEVPAVGTVQEYLQQGPGFIFLYHPALGPLWDVIAQKIRSGALLDGSEMVLEVAEARLVDVTVDGSLLVFAENNVGVDWHHPGNVYWQHKVNRHEACRVILRGKSEFEAYDCRISGNQVFEVPDGCRMVVTSSSAAAGGLSVQLLPLEGDKPTWEWQYSMEP
eukprot:gene1592-1932_t